MKHCKECNKKFIGRDSRKFCSQSCSAKYNNKKFPRRKKEPRLCLYCTCPIEGHGKSFCSQVCYKEYEYRVRVDKWLSNELSGNVGVKYVGLAVWLRKYLIEQADFSCTVCGYKDIHPATGNPILVIDHIDGNHRNSRPNNLRVLCYNCHAKTSTFGSLNPKGKGRPYNNNRKV